MSVIVIQPMPGCYRISSLGGEDVDEVWREHVRDEGTLASYSEAMRGLATGPWKGGNATGDRISWCVQTCSMYLDNRLEQLLFKDLRRQNHSMPTLVDPSLLPANSSVRSVVESFRQQPLRLLDVGSCYNPFLSFPQFLVTAIDIAPASEVRLRQVRSKDRTCTSFLPVQTVTRCDFLNVQIIRNGLESMPNHIMKTDAFDVVVFSLLLSYLPSVKQRFLCCVNAHKALRPHGLLLVITPDSSHQNKHAALIVQWKHCLEAIGFHRYY